MSNVTRDQLIHIKKVLFAATHIECQYGVVNLDDEDRQALFVAMEKHFKKKCAAYYKSMAQKAVSEKQIDFVDENSLLSKGKKK